MESSLVYSQEKILVDDLLQLRNFAYDFLFQYPYTNKFKILPLAITLCQGAANHYAVCKGWARSYYDINRIGIKDFDIWFFFKKAENHHFNARWRQERDFEKSKFGRSPEDSNYMGRRVDFLGRSIDFKNTSVKDSIVYWMRHGSGPSPYWLSKKAIIGLFPDEIFDTLIWVNPDLI
jgi:hypothetical protein